MQKIDRPNRLATLGIVLISLVMAQLPVDGQTRRGTRRQAPTPSAPANTSVSRTKPNKQIDLPAGERVRLIKSPKSLTMAQAFDSNKLPEPARMPSGNIDEQATVLAKAVSVGDESSTASLYASVLAAGYGVRKADGRVVQTMKPGQGLLVEASEVAATAKLYGEGYGVGLGHMGQAFMKIPTLKDTALATELLEGIRKAAKSDQPAVRFWGRFIVELGRNSSARYDLMGQVNPAEVRLDAIQVFLMLSRLAGDLALLDRRARVGQRDGVKNEILSHSHHFRLRNERLTPSQQPCGTSDVNGIILDYGALASTTLHGELLERLGHTGKEIPIANIVLAVLKFILTYAMLETKIELIGPPPLVRTKDTKPGEQRLLVGSVWIENKAEALNCLRPFLNMIGLDFNLPNSGPLADVNVVWEGVLGFDEESRGWISTVRDFIRNLGEEPPPGKRIVYFDYFAGTEHSRTQRTGSSGLSIIFVVGAPQEKDLSREKLTKVARAAGVMFRVQVKSTKMNDLSSQLGTIGDFAGPLIAFLTGDVAGGAVGLATETLYRMSWRGSDPFYFVVRDWEPCNGEWTGTISSSVRRTVKNDSGNRQTGFVHLFESNYSFDGNVTVSGNKATGTAHAEETLSDLQDTGPGYGRTKSDLRQKSTADYSGEVDASVNVDSYGNYSVGFQFPRITGTSQQTVDHIHPRGNSTDTSSDKWEASEYIRSMKGTVDPNNPNVINASRTWSNDGQTQYIFTVKMVRCQ